MRLGILLCGHSPDELAGTHGDIDGMFRRLLGEDAFDYTTWAVVDNQLPDSAEAADGWLITGSKHGVYESHPWIAPLEALVREAYEKHIPVVGVCFGHQLIAQALGGRVEKFQAGWSVGRVDYRLETDRFPALADALGGTPDDAVESDQVNAPILAFHQDQVVEPPPGARVIGESDFCRYAALAYDDRILSLQPHPEFQPAFVGGLLDVRGSLIERDMRDAAHQTLEQPLASAAIGASLREFLQRGEPRKR